MNSMIKTLVSRNKRRYQEDGFDLDLTYIYPNIIAMGFPAEKLEGVYRNHVDDVLRFLDLKHKDHYRVYNLCSERKYDGTKFHNRVVLFPFDDHHPPPIELIKPFCEDLDAWLTTDQQNIAAIHCKAGKGRTGVMICSYLLHRKKFLDAEKCLEYYGKTRTRDGKGVTIPSQRRYVKYYGELIKHEKNYEKTTMFLTAVKFNSIPHINSGSCNVMFEVISSDVKLGMFESAQVKDKDKDRDFKMTLQKPIVVCGDICVDFFHKPPRLGKKERIFQCWFNTFFVQQEGFTKGNSADGQKPQLLTLEMAKKELDKANKDKDNKIYKPDFKVVFYFETVPDVTNGNAVSVSHSKTMDNIHPSVSVGQNRKEFPGRYAQTHHFSNIKGVLVPPGVSPRNVADQLPKMHISDDTGTGVPGNTHSKSGSTGHYYLGSDSKDFQRSLPSSSHSAPDLADEHAFTVRQNVNKQVNRQDRQAIIEGSKKNCLTPVESENSLTSYDTASVGDMEEDFSDTDTDDEWAGCDVTAV